MKTSHILAFALASIIMATISVSCSTAGAYYKGSSGSELALGPTSLFGEQVAQAVDIVTPTGATVKVRGYASHNPDRKVTTALQNYGLSKLAIDGLNHGNDSNNAKDIHFDDNKTGLGHHALTNEGNATAGGQGLQKFATPEGGGTVAPLPH